MTKRYRGRKLNKLIIVDELLKLSDDDVILNRPIGTIFEIGYVQLSHLII